MMLTRVTMLLVLCMPLLGCGTPVKVEAPSTVVVERAVMKTDTLHCSVRTSQAGDLILSMPYRTVASPANNPNIISGTAVVTGTITATKEVEADNLYDFDIDLGSKLAGTEWGPLSVELEPSQP